MASQDIYPVPDYFGGRQGRAWRETGEEADLREVLIDDLMHGQYGDPARSRQKLGSTQANLLASPAPQSKGSRGANITNPLSRLGRECRSCRT